MLSPAVPAPLVSVRIEPGPGGGIHVLAFDGPAQPGTLATFAGVLTLHGFDIVSATVRLHGDGTVHDTFEVKPPAGTLPGTGTVLALARDASEALKGLLDLEMLLASRRRLAPESVVFEPEVEIELGSEITTGIKVRAADRPGLLHDLAKALSDAGMRTRSITILTFNGVARDTFRVVGSRGEVPVDTVVLEAVRRRLLRAAKGS